MAACSAWTVGGIKNSLERMGNCNPPNLAVLSRCMFFRMSFGRRTRTRRPGFGLERSDVDSHPNILAIKASTNLRVGGASCFFLSPCLLPLVSLSTFIPQTKTPTPRRSVTMAIKFTICRGFPSTPNHVWSPFVNKLES